MQRLAFLGTPRLYEWFATSRLGKERVLLDLDRAVLDRLARLADAPDDRHFHYDTAEEVPSELCGEIDCVFFDPPWYSDDYRIWLKRAAALTTTGMAVFPLFPELTRPTAATERRELLTLLESCARDQLVLTDFVDYDVPSFEKAELAACGILAAEPWKIADVVILRMTPPCASQLDVALPTSAKRWIEVDVGRMRFFVDTSRGFEDPRLLFLPPGWSPILRSPSRRDPQRQAANVLTSRGHGVLTSRPEALVTSLRYLAEGLVSGSDQESRLSTLAIDSASLELLRLLLAE